MSHDSAKCSEMKYDSSSWIVVVKDRHGYILWEVATRTFCLSELSVRAEHRPHRSGLDGGFTDICPEIFFDATFIADLHTVPMVGN
jgi:hypothetical protein